MTKIPSVEERVKIICACRKGSMDDKQYKATVEYNLTAAREAGARERTGWTAFAIVDPSSNNYTYDGFFMTKKQAVEVLRNRFQGIKGLTIIEVDVYPALTPPTK